MKKYLILTLLLFCSALFVNAQTQFALHQTQCGNTMDFNNSETMFLDFCPPFDTPKNIVNRTTYASTSPVFTTFSTGQGGIRLIPNQFGTFQYFVSQTSEDCNGNVTNDYNYTLVIPDVKFDNQNVVICKDTPGSVNMQSFTSLFTVPDAATAYIVRLKNSGGTTIAVNTVNVSLSSLTPGSYTMEIEPTSFINYNASCAVPATWRKTLTVVASSPAATFDLTAICGDQTTPINLRDFVRSGGTPVSSITGADATFIFNKLNGTANLSYSAIAKTVAVSSGTVNQGANFEVDITVVTESGRCSRFIDGAPFKVTNWYVGNPVSFTSPTDLCESASTVTSSKQVTTTPSPVGTFDWTSSNTSALTITGTGPTYTINGQDVSSPTTVSVTLGVTIDGCRKSLAKDVIVNPIQDITFTRANNSVYCGYNTDGTAINTLALNTYFGPNSNNTASSEDQWGIVNPTAGFSETNGTLTLGNGDINLTLRHQYRTAKGCVSTADITVNSVRVNDPFAGLLVSTAVCSGAPAALSITNNPGFTITNYFFHNAATGGTELINSSTMPSTFIPTATSTVFGSFVHKGCRSARESAGTVTVNPLPTTPVIADQTKCQGEEFTIIGAGSSNANAYRFYNDPTGGAPLTTGYTAPGTFKTTPVATVTLYADGFNSTTGCVSAARDAIVLNITPRPAAPASATNGEECLPPAASTINVTVSVSGGGPNYNWYTTPTGTTPISGQSSASYTANVGTTTSYYVASVNGSCESSTRAIVTAVIKSSPGTPTVNVIGSEQALCFDGSTNISVNINSTGGAGGSTYKLYSGSDALLDNNNSGLFGRSINTSTTFKVAILALNGCEGAKTSITVAPVNIPSVPTGVDRTSCGPTSTPLSVNTVSGVTFDWFQAATGGAAIASGNSYIPVGGYTADATYFVEAVRTVNATSTLPKTVCRSTSRKQLTISVNPVTPINIGSNLVSLCNGSTVPVYNLANDIEPATNDTATPKLAVGGTFTWTISGTNYSGNNFAPAGQPTGDVVVTYTPKVGASNVFPTCYTSNTRTIRIVSAGSSTNLPSIDVCVNGAEVELTTLATAPGGTWSGQGVTNGSTASFFNPSTAGVATHTLTYTFNQNGCTGTNTLNANVKAAPEKPFVTGNGVVCPGNNITLVGNITGTEQVNYLWYKNGESVPFFESQSPNKSLVYTVTRNEIFEVRTKSVFNCLSPAELISINTPFQGQGDITTPKTIYELGEVVRLQTDVQTGSTYKWEFGDGTESREGFSTAKYYYSPGVYSIKLTITSSQGCEMVINKNNFISVFGDEPDIITDVEESKGTAINVYPNPTSDMINIDTEENVLDYFILTTNNGTLVDKDLVGKKGITQVNLSNLPSGIYYLRIKVKGIETVIRVNRQ